MVNAPEVHLIKKRLSKRLLTDMILWARDTNISMNLCIDIMFSIPGQESWSLWGLLIKACGHGLFNMFVTDEVSGIRQ